jgi:hypothetical protein
MIVEKALYDLHTSAASSFMSSIADTVILLDSSCFVNHIIVEPQAEDGPFFMQDEWSAALIDDYLG